MNYIIISKIAITFFMPFLLTFSYYEVSFFLHLKIEDSLTLAFLYITYSNLSPFSNS